MAIAVLILTLCSSILPTAAEQEDSESNLTVSKEGFFDRFVACIKGLYSGETGELQDSEAIPEKSAADMQQSAASEEAVLKIATPNV